MTADDVRGEDYEAAKPVPARTRVTGDPWVRGHLPECGRYCDGQPPKCRGGDCTLCDEVDCICPALRACQQRERQRSVLLIADAYAAGVQAARDAVAAVPSQSESWSVSWVWKHDALAAIDALRGDHA